MPARKLQLKQRDAVWTDADCPHYKFTVPWNAISTPWEQFTINVRFIKGVPLKTMRFNAGQILSLNRGPTTLVIRIETVRLNLTGSKATLKASIMQGDL